MFASWLVSFLFRACIVLGVATALRLISGKRLGADCRYRLILGAMASLPFLALLSAVDPMLRALAANSPALPAASEAFGLGEEFAFGPAGEDPAAERAIYMPTGLATAISWTWAALTAAALLRSAFLRFSTARAVGRLPQGADREWLEAIDAARESLGFRDRLAVASGPFATPFVSGCFRMSLVLPAQAEGWTRDRREAAMLHELGHAARRDTLLMAIAELCAAPVLCLPFTLVLLRYLVEDREEACDALVMKAGVRPTDYAELILDLASSRGLAATQGMTGCGKTDGRIRGILEWGGEKAGKPASKRFAFFLLFASVLLAVAIPATVAPAEAAEPIALRCLEEDGVVGSELVRRGDLPQGRPLAGHWSVSMPFGIVDDPFSGAARAHPGIDLSNDREGDAVLATLDGRIMDAGFGADRGYFVVIGSGATSALFYHLSSLEVAVGERVSMGAVLGSVGDSGRATGPHLHYEIRVRGVAVDPAEVLSRYVRGAPGVAK
jgi:beta-lactamase regulating signal transducer with metallopeptidase domain